MFPTNSERETENGIAGYRGVGVCSAAELAMGDNERLTLSDLSAYTTFIKYADGTAVGNKYQGTIFIWASPRAPC